MLLLGVIGEYLGRTYDEVRRRPLYIMRSRPGGRVNPDFADPVRELETWHWWFSGRIRILSTVLRRELGAEPLARIADVGCGPPLGARLASPVPRAGRSGVRRRC